MIWSVMSKEQMLFDEMWRPY